MKDFLTPLKTADMRDYAPIPFWSWNNRIEKDEAIRQIEQMKQVGCGGFVLHARTGLKTEYLSEEWFELVGVCLQKAKELNMNAWIYDENGWPSGFVGGELLKEEKYLAPFLEYAEKSEFDAEAYAVFDGDGKRLRAGETSRSGKYRCVYVRLSPANTDILNPEVVEKFIQMTHEEYYARFKDSFGKELVGFFTDEPQYYRWGTPFSWSVAKFWKDRYGEDIADGIIALFEDDEKAYPFRVRYYKAMNELYTENFYKRLYDWCSEHNCMLTGHSVEETSLYTQMWGGAACTPSYEFEHIPGIDNLGHENSARLSARQVGSAAAQLGKKHVLTETFGCSGYASTPDQLRAIAEKQYVHGVNLMCHHLFSYSLAGQGKTDHPPCFSSHMTWWKQFPAFNTYFTRLGKLIADSESLANCVVINPMQSVYLRYDRADESKAFETDNEFAALQARLNEKGILYDLADERLLARHGGVQGKSLVLGKKSYDYVIVPNCRSLSGNTKKVLQEYCKNGGSVYAVSVPQYTDGVADDWSFVRSDTDLDQIARNGAVRLETDGKADYTYRKGSGFEFLYIVNDSGSDAHLRIPEGFSRADLLELAFYECSRDVVLRAGEGALFAPVSGKKPVVYGEENTVDSSFSFSFASDNNLTLDRVSLNKGEGFGEEMPLAEAFDRLLREKYKGKLGVRYAFEAEGVGKKIVLRREKGNYVCSSLNGFPLVFQDCDFDTQFEEADIAPFVRLGRNEYVNVIDFYERDHVFWALFDPLATESVRNCLWYDTEIENVYVRGDFSVDGERRICLPRSPQSFSRLEKNGFPYFSGKVAFKGKIFGKKSHAQIRVEGNYCAVEVWVNGKEQNTVLFGNTAEIILERGKENDVELVAVSSLRNTFGPFHNVGSEFAISPNNFTFRGAWQNGTPCGYDPSYRVVPFGVDRIAVAFEED